MKRRSRRTLRFVVVAGVAATATLAATGITASNTISSSPKAGHGNAAISGYTISGVAYTLNGTNAANIDSVALTTSAAATTVKIKLDASSSSWYSCSTTNGPTNTNRSCTTTSPQATVVDADQLDVVALG